MSRKDSRLRTVQREYGKVFVVVFGIKFQPPEDSRLKVGDDVLVVEGSSPGGVTFSRPKDGHIDRGWSAYGFEGGVKNKPKALAEWAKFMHGEKSHGMVREELAAVQQPVEEPAVDEAPTSLHVTRLPDAADIKELAKDYDATEVVKQTVVRFRERSEATTFRMAASRRGWKVTEASTNDETGETEVSVRVK